jgi:hypothetical protein
MALPSHSKQIAAFWLTMAILLLIAGGMAWLVQAGVRKNETFLPTKSSSHRRTVLREQEPALFWTSIGIYSVIGTGTLGLAAWMLLANFRKSPDIRNP